MAEIEKEDDLLIGKKLKLFQIMATRSIAPCTSLTSWIIGRIDAKIASPNAEDLVAAWPVTQSNIHKWLEICCEREVQNDESSAPGQAKLAAVVRAAIEGLGSINSGRF